VTTGNVSVGKTLTVDGIRITAAAEADVDLDAVVADAVAEDFHEELNPMLSNGNQSPAAATGEAERPATVNWRRVGLHVD